MAAMPQNFTPTKIAEPFIDALIDSHRRDRLPRLNRLWRYFRNPTTRSTDGHLQYAQAEGLPDRLKSDAMGQATPREIVIENDIAWRVQTLVDFMFGKPVIIQADIDDRQRAAEIESFLRDVFRANGGNQFFQSMSLLGAIYGFVDVALRLDHSPGGASSPDRAASRLMIELIEAPRAIAVLNPGDYRQLDAYLLHYRKQLNHLAPTTMLARLRNRLFNADDGQMNRASVTRTELWTNDEVRIYESNDSDFDDRHVVDQFPNLLGRIPVVHIQNLSQPFHYEGLSEIEPLIALQDELNTRLSDRANRVTFQSFKMYLGKGIDKFIDRPVGPGQMWQTDNTDASIQAFGGDGNTPSEDHHIREIREAMDKTSGVTPVAAGLLGGKVGNLTSENALRITLMGLLAKTEKKRLTYGTGITALCELILHAADVHGIFPNSPGERRVRLDWPNPLPASESEQLQNAKLKLEIGVPREQVLTELGYSN